MKVVGKLKLENGSEITVLEDPSMPENEIRGISLPEHIYIPPDQFWAKPKKPSLLKRIKRCFMGNIMKKFVGGIVIALSLFGCVKRLAPEAQNDAPLVYSGQWVVEAEEAFLWCEGHYYLNRPNPDCQTEHGGIVFLVTEIDRDYAIVRMGFSVPGIPTVTPYHQADDICYYIFPDKDCSPNYYIQATQNDPVFPVQWNLKNIKWKQAGGEKLEGVPVAVIDTGTDCSHPDINCVGEYNAITGRQDAGSSYDDNGHGTHVASTVAARCGNGQGICGVSNGAPIYSCKFLGKGGGGALSDAIKCINWAAEKKVKVINASWGCQGCYSKSLKNTIKKARDSGVELFVAAAGNENNNNDINPFYPASYELEGYDPIISVAAIGKRNGLATFSNYGVNSVDISAPGVDIMAGWPGGGDRLLSGTSMASPHVAGAASILIRSGIAEPKKRILSGGSPLPNDKYTSSGKALNLRGSLRTCRESSLRRCRRACQKSRGFTGMLRPCRKACRRRWCQAT